MAGSSPYSQVVEPARFIDPISPDLLLRGATYTQALEEKNLKDIQDSYDTILSIPAYGKDKAKLAEIASGIQDQVSQLSYGDLRSPQTTSQLRNLIKSTINDPDVQAIMNRGYSYQQMQAEKKDYLKRGKEYINPGLEALNQYYAGNDYIRNVNFNNDGFAKPNDIEALKAAKELTGTTKKMVLMSNGEYEPVEYTDPNKFAQNYQYIMNSDPNYQKFNKYDFEKSYQGVDWDTEGNQITQDRIRAAQSAQYYANERLKRETNPIIRQQLADEIAQHQQNIDSDTELLSNPYHGIELKNKAYQNYTSKKAYDAAHAINSVQEGDIKLRETSAKALEHQYKMVEQADRIAREQDKEIAVNEAKETGALSGANAQILLSDLQDFKKDASIDVPNPVGGNYVTRTKAIPGIFQTPIFQKEVISPEKEQKYTTVHGEQVLDSETVKNVKKKESPVDVIYDKNTDKYTLIYSDGSTNTISDQGITDKLIVKNPKLSKYLPKQTGTYSPTHKQKL